MIETIYTCDRCQKPGSIGTEYREMEVSVKKIGPHCKHNAGKKLWCIGCVHHCGIFDPYEVKKEHPVPVPTFESLVREIVQEEIGG